MTTAEFIAEIQARGFSMFDATTIVRYLNFGGRFVANRTRPYWEQQEWDITLDPGDTGVLLSDLEGVKSVDKIIGTTDGYRRKLMPTSEQRFEDHWLPLDLTAAANRAEPAYYYIWQQRIFILPPPQTTRTFVIHGRRRWVDLDAGVLSGTPVTPEEFDEAVILATEVRCNNRAKEPDLAAVARANLEEILSIIEDDSELLMDEEPQRTIPDNRWR